MQFTDRFVPLHQTPQVLDWATGVSHVTDWKAWACGFMFGCATLPAYAFSYFLPIILAGSGFSGQLALLLSAPPYCAAAFYTFFVSVILPPSFSFCLKKLIFGYCLMMI
jgi:hypothetical protein